MKRLLVFLLILIFALSLFACGNPNDDANSYEADMFVNAYDVLYSLPSEFPLAYISVEPEFFGISGYGCNESDIIKYYGGDSRGVVVIERSSDVNMNVYHVHLYDGSKSSDLLQKEYLSESNASSVCLIENDEVVFRIVHCDDFALKLCSAHIEYVDYKTVLTQNGEVYELSDGTRVESLDMVPFEIVDDGNVIEFSNELYIS